MKILRFGFFDVSARWCPRPAAVLLAFGTALPLFAAPGVHPLRAQGPAAPPPAASPVDPATLPPAPGSLVTKDQFIRELARPAAPVTGRKRGVGVRPVPPPQVSVQILFKTGSVEIADEASLRQLREAGEALRSGPLTSYHFEIEGHTDNVGGDADNLQLSRRRAQAIVTHLRTLYDVAADRLEPIGKGENAPVADNSTEAGRALNRRVVFKRREP